MANSRIEALLENILGADNELLPPESRNEKILYNILGIVVPMDLPPQSPIEELLIEILNEDYQAFRNIVDGTITEITPTMLQGVTSIRDNAFRGCSQLESVELPEGITSIGNQVFYACYALDSLSLPSTLTSIGSYAFVSCIALTEIEIPEGVTAIATYTFQKCEALEKITLPSTIESIAAHAFDQCAALTDFTILATTPPTLAATSITGLPNDVVISVPAAAVDAYKAASYWSDYADNIQAISA